MKIKDRLFISSSCLDGDRRLPVILEKFIELSIKNVELSAPHPYLPIENVKQILAEYRNKGMRFNLHNYFPPPEFDFVLNIASFNQQVRTKTISLINAAIDVANHTDSIFYGCHAGYLADGAEKNGRFHFIEETIGDEGKCRDQALMTIVEILNTNTGRLKSCGLLIENLFPMNKISNFSLTCLPEDIITFFNEIADSRVGLLLDLAHLELTCIHFNLDPDLALKTIIHNIGNAVKAVHLSGHDGVFDIHGPVLPGSWQLEAAKRLNALFVNEDELYFTLESRALDETTLLGQIDLIHKTLDIK